MVALVGLLIEPSPQAAVNPHVSADLSAREHDTWPMPPLAVGVFSQAGTITAGPAAVVPVALAGIAAYASMSDIYGRVHIIPRTIDIGDVTQTVSEPFEVWNAHLTSQALTSIDGSGTDGMALTGQPLPGTTFNPNESRIYSLDVGTTGAAVIDGVYTFHFAGEDVTLAVGGRRVIPLAFSPNWSRGFTERLEWKTDVIPARDSSEQRIQLRARPRRTYAYEVMTHDEQGPLFENLIYAWQSRIFGLPAWHQARKLPGDLSAGAIAVNVDTTGAEYVADGMAIVYAAPDSYEILRIQSVAPGSLTLKEPAISSWSAGVRIMPLHTGRLPARLSVNNRTIKVAEFGVIAAIDSNNPVAAAPPAETYRSIPVITKTPNRIAGYRQDYLREWQDIIDNGTGRVVVDDVAQGPGAIREFRWLLQGRTEVEAFKGWLGYLAGRLNVAWIPDRSDDFELVTPVGAVDVGLRVKQNGYASRVGPVPGRRDLFILLKTGATLTRRIIAATNDGADQLLTLDAAVGQAIDPADIRLISFLSPCRLETDAVEIHWHTTETAEVAALFRTMPDEL